MIFTWIVAVYVGRLIGWYDDVYHCSSELKAVLIVPLAVCATLVLGIPLYLIWKYLP